MRGDLLQELLEHVLPLLAVDYRWGGIVELNPNCPSNSLS